jgi:predicted small lipoprotein YifL
MIWRRALLALALAGTLAGCGKKAAPLPYGPADQVTYPRSYPAY